METNNKQSRTREDGLKFLRDMDLEFPPVQDFVLTNSGIVEPLPTKSDAWDQFQENTKKRKDNNG